LSALQRSAPFEIGESIARALPSTWLQRRALEKKFKDARQDLERRFGVLPEDFDVEAYKSLNADLTRVFDRDWQFALHYLEHGCREGRRYSHRIDSRRNVLLTRGANPSAQRGLEFGALDKPVVRPNQGDIRFVDYTTQEGLRAHPYADGIDRDKIVSVDYVWTGSGSLAEVIGTREQFDYAIASHVIEHVPNIIGWFDGIYDVLRPGGVFNLAIPDKRFTFDFKRNLSTLGDLVEAHLLNYTYPSIKQMFDHCYYAVDFPPDARWKEAYEEKYYPKYCGDLSLQLAYDQSLLIKHNEKYLDSHCLIVTPESFLAIIEDLSRLRLIKFVLREFYPTIVGAIEFFCHFEKSIHADAADLLQEQLSCLEIHKTALNYGEGR
jgi:SAM-dependent methyltransferase